MFPLPNKVCTLAIDQIELISKVPVCLVIALGNEAGVLIVIDVFDPNSFARLNGVGLVFGSI